MPFLELSRIIQKKGHNIRSRGGSTVSVQNYHPLDSIFEIYSDLRLPYSLV